jgi:nitrile hydratase beta subunit
VNGVHDMGGMHGLGPIDPDPNEPLFLADWERRVLALNLASPSRWNIDASRHQRESIPGPTYLRMTYYEKWFRALTELLAVHGILSPREIETGQPDPGTPPGTPRLTADRVAAVLRHGGPATREVDVKPAYQPGDRVRARNINPTGHTRLPRYVKGHEGVVVMSHGNHVFPDTNAHFQGENAHPLYNVRFEARELWGEDASARDAIHVDLWERYLERA